MKILLSPAVAEGTVAEPSMASAPPISGWMSTVGPLETTDEPPKREGATDGQDDPARRPAANQPLGVLPVADDTVAKAKADQEAAAKSKVEADRIAAEKTAEGAKTGDDEPEKWPRNSADWDKFKEKRAKREAKLNEEIKTQSARVKELEAKTVEYETKLKATPEVDPEIQTKLQRLEAQNKELTDKIIVLDVTAHPDFVSHYTNRVNEAKDDAKSILGQEKGEAFVKLLDLPEGEWKNLQMEEFYAGLNEVEKSEIGTVRKELRLIERDRKKDIADAESKKAKILTEGATKAKATAEQNKKMMVETFNAVTKAVQNPENGNPMFQTREDDDAWNAEIPKRIETVKNLLLNNIKPEAVVRAAYNAVSLPIVLQHYQADRKAWGEEKAKLEAQVKALSAAQPGAGGAGGPAGGSKVDDSIPDGTDPVKRNKLWAESMQKSMREGLGV